MGAVSGLFVMVLASLLLFIVVQLVGFDVTDSGTFTVLAFALFFGQLVSGYVGGRLTSADQPGFHGSMSGMALYAIFSMLALAAGSDAGPLPLIVFAITAAMIGYAGGTLGGLSKLVPLLALPMWARQSGRPGRMLSLAMLVMGVGLLPVLWATGGVPPGLLRYAVSWEFNGPLFEPLWRSLAWIGAPDAVAVVLDRIRDVSGWHDFLNPLYHYRYPQFLAKLVLWALPGGGSVALARSPRQHRRDWLVAGLDVVVLSHCLPLVPALDPALGGALPAAPLVGTLGFDPAQLPAATAGRFCMALVLPGGLAAVRAGTSEESEMVYRLTLSYVGTAYAGWQRQGNALAIQQVVEEALARVFRQEVGVTAAGRTDAGVHARGQVAHLQIDRTIDLVKLLSGTNHHLPRDIRVMAAERVR